jgi:hypothetical protein
MPASRKRAEVMIGCRGEGAGKQRPRRFLFFSLGCHLYVRGSRGKRRKDRR